MINPYSVRHISCFFALAYKNQIFSYFMLKKRDKYAKAKISINCVIFKNSRTPVGLKTMSKHCKG